ncbi:hypothetical protein [Gordonia polyisoprenivorans]|uniref:PIN-like domain-containing protein n=1 Tax=Gordonia polyisoprenivorans TaxID=84595 RepID=UPI001AD6F372|nr:hypothetical protein J6U32_24110 [Gordonia polyisoprenivorans]
MSREPKWQPPHASSWAAPPEFYLDENLAGRALRRRIEGYGYVVHTPPSLYGERKAAEGTPDEVWLRDVGRRGWAAIGRDTTILVTPSELAAYRRAKIHLFLFHGEATRAQLLEALDANLREMCTHCMSGTPTVWRVHGPPRPRLEAL